MSTADLHFERRPAIQGWRWLQRAFAMFRRYWVIWSLLVVAYLVLISLIAPIPYLGRSAAFILKPIFTVGFLAAAWSQERGEDPKLSQLFAGFRSNLYALVPIGFVYWIGIMLALLATAWGDQGTMARFIFYGEIPRDDYLSSPELERAMLIALACAVPVVLANWFAPALVVFGDAVPIAALTTSLRAALV